MKRILLLIVGIFALFPLSFAQNGNRIALAAYVADNCGVPVNSRSVLQNKLTQLIAGCGFASEPNQRFVLTAKVDVLTEDVTATTPAMFAYTLSYNLYIGDGVSGTLFASTSVQAKGVGVTKEKAYAQALKSINANSPELRQFVAEGKQKIIDYYVQNCASIIKHAQTLAANQEFDEAMWELSAIPDVCDDCYDRANDMIVSIYQKSVDQEGQVLLAEARSAWAAGQDREAAEKAGTILSHINPQSSAYSAAQSLTSQIAARVKALDNREWAFELQKQKDNTSVRKAQINSARDVAVAWAKNQPKTIYKVYWW